MHLEFHDSAQFNQWLYDRPPVSFPMRLLEQPSAFSAGLLITHAAIIPHGVCPL